MKRRAKIAGGLLAFVLILISFLVAVIVITPRLINHAAVKNKIRREVSELVKGEFDVKQLSVSFFPAPKLVVDTLKINRPRQIFASAGIIEIYPEILPLFIGKFMFKKIRVEGPEFTVILPESMAGEKSSSRPFEIHRLIPALSTVLDELSQMYPPVVRGIFTQGSIDLVHNNKTILALHDIEIDLQNTSKNLTFRITAASNMIDSVSIQGSLQGKKKVSAHMALKNIQTGTVYNTMLPEAVLKIHGGSDVTLDLAMADSEKITAAFHLASPGIRLEHAGRKADIKIKEVSGSIGVTADAAIVTLSELLLDNSSMGVSGSFTMSDQEPKLRLQLEGRDLDINAARSAVLVMTGEDTAVQTVFDILKGGTIPRVEVSGQANTPADLGNLETLAVRGQLQGATIKIPGTELEMTDVTGNIDLLHGILKGEDLQARWGSSSVLNGLLTLDLAKDPLPLQFETGIQADMKDIPAILARIIQDQEIKNELAQLRNVQGSARGKLLLTGDTDHLKIDVSATDIVLAGRYHKIPYPLSLKKGSLAYDGNRIRWDQLDGSIGTSSFTAFSGSLDLGQTNDFKITSGAFRILVPELMPWISSHAKTQKLAEYLGDGKSILHLSKVSLSGRVQDFYKWQFNIAGDLTDFVFQNLPSTPGHLEIASLKFKADPQTLEYTNGKMGLLDTSLTVSGIHRQYMTNFMKDARWTFDGQIGQQTIDWLSQTIEMPAWLKLRPLSFAPSSLACLSQGGYTFAAALAFQDGLEMSADLTVNADGVVVKQLTIKDETSQATLAGSYQDPSIEVSFDGILHESALARLFQVSPPLSSSIGGKARIRVNLDNLSNMKFDGNLKGWDLYIPLGMKTPLSISNILVKGAPEAIVIESSDLSWSDMNLTLSGNIKPVTSELLALDLDIAADTIDVEKIMNLLGDRNKPMDQEPAAPPRPLPIKGIIRFKAQQFKTGAVTIEPLSADIRVQDNRADILLKEAELCGIPVSGTIKISRQEFEYHLEPAVHARQLDTTLNCFMGKQIKADGTIDAKGIIEGKVIIEGHGWAENLLKSLSGYMDLSISNGHIYKDILVHEVVEFINATGAIQGIITKDQMQKKGVGFKRLETHIILQNGKLQVEKLLLDGNQLTMIGEGELDLIQNQTDFTLLVAPQKTVTTFLKYIPLIGGILQTVTAIPLSLKGPVDNIQVLPLAPSAVKYELKEIMKETLDLKQISVQ